MTTREFIERTYNTVNTKWGAHGYDRWCSSVKTDGNGIVYSYGSHYPLAFHVAGLDFINNAGYSVTTAKHISWAWQAVGYHAIAVKLWSDEASVISFSGSTEEQKINAIKTALKREYNDLYNQLKAKKRKDTQVYADLKSQLFRVHEFVQQVEAL